MFNNLIDLSISILCEMTNTDEQIFRKKLRNIEQVVWGSVYPLDKWREHQNLYKQLLDEFLKNLG